MLPIKSFKFLVSLLCAFVIAINIKAQTTGPTLAKVTPPSPNMQAFQKYGNIPVSPYTGIPNISIPLYDVKFRDITVPISLSYHASGIKVSEEASQVGLGWVINTGGSISRNIIGDDDFYGSVYFNSAQNNVMDFADGQGPRDLIGRGCTLNMFNKSIANSPTLYTYDIYDYLHENSPVDFQPDQYFYNFLDKSGKFIVKRNRQAILQKQEKIQIINTGTNGSSWQIKSADGYTFDFNAAESYHSLEDHYSAWYLTKITSPTGNTVTFNYTTVPRYVTSVGGYSELLDYQDLPVPYGGGADGNRLYSAHNTGWQKGSIPGKDYTLVVLDNIDFNTGIVKFNYSDRLDISGDKKLDSLTVFTKDKNGTLSSQPLKTIALSYNYFDNGNTDNDAGNGNSPRLKLLSVQQKGSYNNVNTVEKPYLFTYNENIWMPSKGSFARDHWGYYNGKLGNTSLIPSVISVSSPDLITRALGVPGPEREPNSSYVNAYSLLKIQYPTGGSTEFQYESNDFDEQQSQVNDASYFSKTYTVVQQTTTINYDNQNTTPFFPSDTLDLSNEYIFTENPLTQNATYVNFNVAFRFSDYNYCSTHPYPFPVTDVMTFDIYDVTGTNLIMHKDASYFPVCSGGSTEGCTVCGGPVLSYNSSNLLLPPGKYKLKVHVDPSYASSLQDIHFNFTYYTQVGTATLYGNANALTFSTGGGQRIARIIDHEADGSPNVNVKKFVYHYFADKNNSGQQKEYSYGRRMSHPVYNYFVINDVLGRVVLSQGSIDRQFVAPRLMRSADSDIPLNGSAAGAVVGYDRVTVLYGENGENGKTEYQYVNQPDHVSDYSSPLSEYGLPLQPPYASNVPELLNGSVLVQKDYINKAGQFQIAKSVTNTYENALTNDNVVYGMEVRKRPYELAENGSYTSDMPTDICESGSMMSYFNLVSKFLPLRTTTERDYTQNDTTKYSEVNTSYYYDNYLHYQPTRVVTINSKGEQIITQNKYPLDYTITGTPANPTAQGIKNLIDKNLVGTVVEKITKKADANGANEKTLSAVYTSYKPTLPLPDVIQATNTVQPLGDFTPSSITASSAAIDTRYKQYVLFDQYDNYGHIVQQHMLNGALNSYIWDYNSTSPIAQVINAGVTDIAYAGFEWDGTGGWTIGSTLRDNASAFSGRVSYNLSNGSVTKSGLTAANTYVVSYWTKNPTALTITGTITGYPIKGTTINGWTYYEHQITGQTTITVSGSGNIDELRLYPKSAQMTTYTYSPLIGVTGSIDPKNNASYYEYDGLGRLQNIKDKDGNIVKHFDYHYQGQ